MANTYVIQSYVAPFIAKSVEFAIEDFAPFNETVFQLYILPALKVKWLDKTCGEYGEWIHNRLDAVGFIPGLGDIMDGVNGINYLAEGRSLEASSSAAAMIPVLGDLAKVGKLGLKLGAELVEEGVETVAKEVAEELTEQARNLRKMWRKRPRLKLSRN